MKVGEIMTTKEYSVGYESFFQGVKACVPTILGYVGIGLAAGIVGKSSGLSLIEIALLSMIVYAGSAQFIISGMILLGSPLEAIVLTTFLVNLRHFLMSLSVADYFKKDSLLASVGIGTLLTDESYGVLMTALQNKRRVSVSWTNGLNLTAYLTWIVATILGGLIGEWIPNPEQFGLDFALTAMFIGLIILQAELPMRTQTKKTVIILAAVGLSLYLMMGFFSPEMSVIGATLIGCTVGMVIKNDCG